ncbi:MAG: hypothetical protein F6J96_21960 [Symploca sp. SIO1C2]|nr:hypothetical protein [Symploca sp. SIO1C2]
MISAPHQRGKRCIDLDKIDPIAIALHMDNHSGTVACCLSSPPDLFSKP